MSGATKRQRTSASPPSLPPSPKADDVDSLVALVRDGSCEQKTTAINALWKMVHISAHRKEIVNADGINPLLALVREGTAR